MKKFASRNRPPVREKPRSQHRPKNPKRPPIPERRLVLPPENMVPPPPLNLNHQAPQPLVIPPQPNVIPPQPNVIPPQALPEVVQKLEFELQIDPQPFYMRGLTNFILIETIIILIHFFMGTGSTVAFLITSTSLNLFGFILYIRRNFRKGTEVYESEKLRAVMLTLISIGIGCYVLFDVLLKKGDSNTRKDDEELSMIQITVVLGILYFFKKILQVAQSIYESISDALKTIFNTALAVTLFICLFVAYTTSSTLTKIVCAVIALLCVKYFYGYIVTALVQELSQVFILPLFLLSVYFAWNIISHIQQIGTLSNEEESWLSWFKGAAKYSQDLILHVCMLILNSVLFLGVMYVMNRFQDDLAQSVVTIYQSIIILIVAYFFKKINFV